MSANNTRNLAADGFQRILTNIINLVSFLLLLVSSYVIFKFNKSRISPYSPILYLSCAFMSEFYLGTVLNVVVLLPVPGFYCIGWAKNSNDLMKLIHVVSFVAIKPLIEGRPLQARSLQILAYKLFLLQGEILFIILVLKLQTVSRNDSVFKLNCFIQTLVILVPLMFNSSIAFVIIIQSNFSKHYTDVYISDNLPYHEFLRRYEFVWILTAFKEYIGFAAVLCCSLGQIFVLVFLGYVLILYELERQATSLSKEARKEWKEFIDKIRNHGAITVVFFCALPFSGFVQLFVEEETDVSFPVAFAFLIFVSAPVAANLLFLWNDPAYRSQLFCKFSNRNRRRQPNQIRVTSKEML
ncbi:Protein CBG26954 [Caenorhabditis briggsae]|uniref:Protein CBG26954 n=1 Tax=Caenorhabditis briggsae TaxID=6238 RepID=B6IHU7_CAEBR|nr:Protein CBG26954 [Caenorhabditis briggsae]CAR99477.1 Protein CBG26954 [Caenorhabditis briggsae]